MEGQDQGDELYPIAVLIDELKVRIAYDWRLPHASAAILHVCSLTCDAA